MLFNKTSLDEVMQISEESNAMIAEAMISDQLTKDEICELTSCAEACNELKDLGIVTEKTIVRLDKRAKLSRAFQTAVFTIAREKKDPLMKKLLTVWRMERTLESKLATKYRAEATKRARLMVAKAGSAKKDTKSGVIAKAVNGAKKQFNPTTSK